MSFRLSNKRIEIYRKWARLTPIENPMIQKFSKFDIDEKCDDGYFIVDVDDLISSIEGKCFKKICCFDDSVDFCCFVIFDDSVDFVELLIIVDISVCCFFQIVTRVAISSSIPVDVWCLLFGSVG